ncbi:Bowman-Birk type bran trypsin inhibitor-like [Oryza brachyantha]|nr:Bowman-Birk type bran trypsin inhibitor-like [Oryza brachyantha]
MSSSTAAMATSSILLIFLLAGLSAADANTIRLPSDGGTPPRPAKPWDCCDNAEQSPFEVFPPLFRCNDEVQQCAAACKECVEAPGDFPRGAFVCRDWYATEDPGPTCAPAPGKPTKKRPWKCCDNVVQLPEKISPPFWRCNDELEPSQCTAACKVCQEAPRPFPGPLICEDVYWGADPGPLCTQRPWGKCCDNAACTKSIPPICRCADEVASCAAACKDCRPVKSSKPPRYVCKDQFTGQPGPKCKR